MAATRSFWPSERGETLAHRAVHRIDPLRGILLAIAGGQPLDPVMRDPGLGADHRRFQVQNHGASAAVADFNPQEMHDGVGVRRANGGEFRHESRFDKPRRMENRQACRGLTGFEDSDNQPP